MVHGEVAPSNNSSVAVCILANIHISSSIQLGGVFIYLFIICLFFCFFVFCVMNIYDLIPRYSFENL